MKFDDLKPGLQSTKVSMNLNQEAYGTHWVGFVVHEVLYVNKSEK